MLLEFKGVGDKCFSIAFITGPLLHFFNYDLPVDATARAASKDEK